MAIKTYASRLRINDKCLTLCSHRRLPTIASYSFCLVFGMVICAKIDVKMSQKNTETI